MPCLPTHCAFLSYRKFTALALLPITLRFSGIPDIFRSILIARFPFPVCSKMAPLFSLAVEEAVIEKSCIYFSHTSITYSSFAKIRFLSEFRKSLACVSHPPSWGQASAAADNGKNDERRTLTLRFADDRANAQSDILWPDEKSDESRCEVRSSDYKMAVIPPKRERVKNLFSPTE